ALWRKVHFISLSPECLVSFDPVARAPRRNEVGHFAYNQWLKCRIDRIVRDFLRRVSEANIDVMNRLKRWLKSVLWMCLVAVDDDNTHAGLDKALQFTDPESRAFQEWYPRVSRFLPHPVRRNFENLIQTKRAQDREKWLESTINKLEDVLSPL